MKEVDRTYSQVGWDSGAGRVSVLSDRQDTGDEIFTHGIATRDGTKSFSLTSRWATTQQGNWQAAFPIFLTGGSSSQADVPGSIYAYYYSRDSNLQQNPSYFLRYKDASGTLRINVEYVAARNTEYRFFFGYEALTRELQMQIRNTADTVLASGTYTTGTNPNDGFTLGKVGIASDGWSQPWEPVITAWTDDITICCKTGGNGFELMGYRWGGFGTNYWIWENTQDLSNEKDAVIEAFNRWNGDPASGVGFSYGGYTTACDNVWDGINSVCWKDFPDNDPTPAYTVSRRGFPDLGQFAEADMVFNDDYFWYYSFVRDTATHEAGHWVGLGDLYDNGDPEDNNQVMSYGTDIYWGDAMGVRYVYPYIRDPYTVGDENQGLGSDIANLDGNSNLDVVVAWADNPYGENHIRWRVGLDISSTDGNIQSWQTTREATFWIGAENSGVGAAVAAIDADSTPDLLVAWVTNPNGGNGIYYRIGWDLTSSGDVTWSSMFTVPGWVGDDTFGLGAAIANIGGSSRPDLIIAWVDSAYGWIYYKIGWDLTTDGAASWGSEIATGLGRANTVSCGLAVGDIDQNGILDVVVSTRYEFWVGWDMRSDGQVTGWSRLFSRTWGGPELGNQGLGLAIYKFAGSRWPSILGIGIVGQFGADTTRYLWS